jgi:hypothetical protein
MVAGIRAAVPAAKLADVNRSHLPHAQHGGMGVPGVAGARRKDPA